MTLPTLFMVEIVVANLERSQGWYEQLLQSQPTFQDRVNRFVLFTTASVRVALKEGASNPGTTRLIFEVAELNAEIVRLSACGISMEGESKTSPEGYVRGFFRDPDGHSIGLFQWLPSRAGIDSD